MSDEMMLAAVCAAADQLIPTFVYVSKAARSDVLTDPPKMRALSREQIVELRIVA